MRARPDWEGSSRSSRYHSNKEVALLMLSVTAVSAAVVPTRPLAETVMSTDGAENSSSPRLGTSGERSSSGVCACAHHPTARHIDIITNAALFFIRCIHLISRLFLYSLELPFCLVRVVLHDKPHKNWFDQFFWYPIECEDRK